MLCFEGALPGLDSSQMSKLLRSWRARSKKRIIYIVFLASHCNPIDELVYWTVGQHLPYFTFPQVVNDPQKFNYLCIKKISIFIHFHWYRRGNVSNFLIKTRTVHLKKNTYIFLSKSTFPHHDTSYHLNWPHRSQIVSKTRLLLVLVDNTFIIRLMALGVANKCFREQTRAFLQPVVQDKNDPLGKYGLNRLGQNLSSRLAKYMWRVIFVLTKSRPRLQSSIGQ